MKILSSFKRYVQKKLGITQLIAEYQEFTDKRDMILACEQEALKAHLFRDTITDSEWLRYKSFSPGGWAVDYGLLYTLFRILNDVKPKNIIEFGLGQSSKLVHQYQAFYQDVNAFTCEHNAEWVEFFKSGINEKYPIAIKMLDLLTSSYQGFETLVYQGLEEVTKGQKYDLILVDGPYGTEHYSRSQLIDLSKDHLAERFCIVVDDYERQGEQETVSEVKRVLKERNIQYEFATYKASKQHCVICSKDLEFLSTLCWF